MASDVCSTVGLRVGTLPTVAEPGARPRAAASRELPRISIDLQRTVPQAAPAPASPGLGSDLEVLATLGEGGMGRVVLARQHSLDREVAIKTLRDGATTQEVDALLSEGTITGHLEHPAIVPVHALGVERNGQPVLVMKRVEGVDWQHLLDDPHHRAWEGRGGEPSDRLRGHLEILMQVCTAAHFAHSRSIVHRDIKPQNVLLGRYGEVYLGDWGLALRTGGAWQPQPLCGTPAYMAPEMVSGEPVDARTDVYLLGATLHQILVGTPRHQSRDTDGALALALESRPFDYAPSVPPELAALANRATARDPAARPADAWQVRQAIADYLQHRSSIALAGSAAERVARLRALAGDEAALGRESVQHDLDVLAAEARFGLEQALREWKDNPVASRALEELDALQASRRARSAALERLARELDPSISSRQRAIGLGVLAVVGVALSIGGFLTEQATLTPRALLYQSLAPLGGVLVVAVVLRRHLFGTDLNRRLAHAAIVAVLSVVASNAVGCAAGVSVPHLLAFDALVFAAITAQGAALMFRWLAFFSVVMLGVAVWAASFPDQAMRAFSLGTGVSLVVSAWLSRGSARKLKT